MFDPTNPFDLKAAQEYEAELFAEAKANPKIGVGMSVRLVSYDRAVEGRVMDIRWNDSFVQYEALVLHDGEKFWILEMFLRRSLGPIRDVFVNKDMK